MENSPNRGGNWMISSKCISTIEVSGDNPHAKMKMDVFMLIPAHEAKYYAELNPESRQ